MSRKNTKKPTDRLFQQRIVLTMAAEFSDLKKSFDRLLIQYKALAESQGVKVLVD